MTTTKLALKIRSVTYPNYETKDKVKTKKTLVRTNSVDYFDDSRLLVKEESSRKELSREGRTKGKLCQISHSCSTDAASSRSRCHLSSGHKPCRYSLDDYCTSAETDFSQSVECDKCGSNTCSPTMRGDEIDLSLETTTERLLDWRKTSPDKRCVGRSRSYDVMLQFYRSPERWSKDKASGTRRRRLCTSTSVPPPEKSSSTEKFSSEEAPETTGNNVKLSQEGRRRRSQFRRALSVFSLTCNSKDLTKDRRKSKSPQQKILRPPTRHVYRKGVSGLPVECSQNYLGLAY